MAITFDTDKYEITKSEGVATMQFNDKEVFNQDTDISKKDMVEVFKHSAKFITATNEEATNKAKDMFKEDKLLNKVVINYPYGPTGSGSVNLGISREKTFKIPGTDKTVSRPDIQVAVKHNQLKAGKTAIKALQQDIAEALNA